jgi:hypothetical protein
MRWDVLIGVCQNLIGGEGVAVVLAVRDLGTIGTSKLRRLS